MSALDDWYYDPKMCHKALIEHFLVASLNDLELKKSSSGINAAGMILQS